MSKLTIAIGVTTAAMKRGLAGAQTRMKMWSKNITGMASRAATGIGTAMAAGVIFATAKIITAADEIAKSSQRIGFTAEAYQKLAFAIRRSGGQTADAEKSVKRMQSSVDDLSNGLSTAVRSFDDLGLTYDNLKGKSPEEQFALIVEKLNQITDAGKKSALAQDIFGRSGVALIPMLATYKELTKEAEELGGIISNETVKASEELKDSMENLKASMTVLISESGIISWLADIGKKASEAVKAMNALDAGGMMEGETIETAAPTKTELTTAKQEANDGGIDHNQGLGLSRFVPIDAKERTGATIQASLAAPTKTEVDERRGKIKQTTQAAEDKATADQATATDAGDVELGIEKEFNAALAALQQKRAEALRENAMGEISTPAISRGDIKAAREAKAKEAADNAQTAEEKASADQAKATATDAGLAEQITLDLGDVELGIEKEFNAALAALKQKRAEALRENAMGEISTLDLGDVELGFEKEFNAALADGDAGAQADKEKAANIKLTALQERAAAIADKISGAGPAGGGTIASSLARIGGERGKVVQPQLKAAQQQFRELQAVNKTIADQTAKLDALIAVGEAAVAKIDFTQRF